MGGATAMRVLLQRGERLKRLEKDTERRPPQLVVCSSRLDPSIARRQQKYNRIKRHLGKVMSGLVARASDEHRLRGTTSIVVRVPGGHARNL